MDDIPGDERTADRRHEREGGERRQLERCWDERQHGDARRQPARPDPAWSLGRRAADEVDQSHAQRDVREEVEREATAECHGGHRVQGLADVLDRRLETKCEQDDPGDHRQVQVAVEVASEPGSLRAARLRKLTLRHDGDDVEVRPPERGDDDDPKDGGADDAGGEREAGGPYAERDDRFAERDDDDEPVPLGEVTR